MRAPWTSTIGGHKPTRWSTNNEMDSMPDEYFEHRDTVGPPPGYGWWPDSSYRPNWSALATRPANKNGIYRNYYPLDVVNKACFVIGRWDASSKTRIYLREGNDLLPEETTVLSEAIKIYCELGKNPARIYPEVIEYNRLVMRNPSFIFMWIPKSIC